MPDLSRPGRRWGWHVVARRVAAATLSAGLFVGMAGQAFSAARPVVDCPMHDARFSIDSPLIDLLLSPAARTAIVTIAPGSLQRLPPVFTTTRTPSFGTILSLRTIGGMAGLSADQLVRIDAALRRLPVTRDDRTARCARYDDDAPALTIPATRPRLLVFEKITGFRDGPSVDAAHRMLTDIATANGWGIVATDRGGAITPATLAKFDAVVWNNVSGDVLTVRQRLALRRYVESGGGFLAMHGSGGDPVYFWDWYADNLIGARFTGHPDSPQFQDARIVMQTTPSGIGRGLPAQWALTDEWYSFKVSPRGLPGLQVVAALDERSYKPTSAMTGDLRMGDHPIAWTRCVGNGRTFYSAIGHQPAVYSAGTR